MDTIFGFLGYTTGIAYMFAIFFIPMRLIEIGEKGKASNRTDWPVSNEEASQMIEDSTIRIPFSFIKIYLTISFFMLIPSFFAKESTLFGKNAIWISSIFHYFNLFFIIGIVLLILKRLFFVFRRKATYNDTNYIIALIYMIGVQVVLFFINNPIATNLISRLRKFVVDIFA